MADAFISKMSKSSTIADLIFAFILLALRFLLGATAILHPSFKDRLKEKDFSVQIGSKDSSVGRFFSFRGGRIRSKMGIHPNSDVTISYARSALAVKLIVPWRDPLAQISAMKNFQIYIAGPDELTSWFLETISLMLVIGTKYGTDAKKGVKRYVTGTNGGPLFVYVRDGKILRTTPIEFDDKDAQPWTIEARGRNFTPPSKTTLSPYSFSWKSMVYSPDRLLYPMKRTDFDPEGERNCSSRGISGYDRISWDEALKIVTNEIKRVKGKYGPGAILSGSGSHHMWGSIGYWLSARLRFFNSIGFTPVVHNPDSWEGWYWGAMHHYGNSMRLGATESYGTVEDILRECDMVVFWSIDPDMCDG